jgi:hypothetical protein
VIFILKGGWFKFCRGRDRPEIERKIPALAKTARMMHPGNALRGDNGASGKMTGNPAALA